MTGRDTGWYNWWRHGAVQPAETWNSTTGGDTGRYNQQRDGGGTTSRGMGVLQPAEGWGGTTGGDMGWYNRRRHGVVHMADELCPINGGWMGCCNVQ